MIDVDLYPTNASERSRWIVERRGPKNALDVSRPYAWLFEEEPGADGRPVPTATVFLTNRECPYRCLMCDLWRNTLDFTAPVGSIPKQIEYALERLPAVLQIKLYNAGSFFDDRAVPPEEDEAIALLVRGFDRVIVESHPACIGERCLRFQDRIAGRLEVAIGLETVHPVVLQRLNKRFDAEQFRAAAERLRTNSVDLRVFVLVKPPFLSEVEGVGWAARSLEFAFDCGACVCCLIPTRGGNGAMESLQVLGQFSPPKIASLEAALESGLRMKRGRIFADVWDIERFVTCVCDSDRIARITEMNSTQSATERRDRRPCDRCGAP